MLAALCGLWDRKAAGPKPCRPSRHVDPMTPAYLHQSAGTIHHVPLRPSLEAEGETSDAKRGHGDGSPRLIAADCKGEPPFPLRLLEVAKPVGGLVDQVQVVGVIDESLPVSATCWGIPLLGPGKNFPGGTVEHRTIQGEVSCGFKEVESHRRIAHHHVVFRLRRQAIIGVSSFFGEKRTDTNHQL